MARAILPVKYGGCGAKVIFIDSQHNLPYLKVREMLLKYIGEDQDALAEAESNLDIYKVNDIDQLDNALTTTSVISSSYAYSLFCVDAVGDYFWLDEYNEEVISAESRDMKKYIELKIKKFRKICDKLHLSCVYVRSSLLDCEIDTQHVKYTIKLSCSPDPEEGGEEQDVETDLSEDETESKFEPNPTPFEDIDSDSYIPHSTESESNVVHEPEQFRMKVNFDNEIVNHTYIIDLYGLKFS